MGAEEEQEGKEEEELRLTAVVRAFLLCTSSTRLCGKEMGEKGTEAKGRETGEEKRRN